MHFYHDLLPSLISCQQKLVYSCITFLYFLNKKPHDNGILLKRALIAAWLNKPFSSLINLDFSYCTLHTLTQALFLIFKDFEFRFYHVVSFLHFNQYDIWSHRCIISIDSVGQFYTFVLSFRLCLSFCLNTHVLISIPCSMNLSISISSSWLYFLPMLTLNLR